MTDDLRIRLAGALTALADLDPELADECTDALLPIVEAHGRACAAAALREEAETFRYVFGDTTEARWLRNRNRARADALDATTLAADALRADHP